MRGVDTRIVQTALRRLVDHQPFDRRDKRAGGEEPWPYAAPRNYGCEASVSCQPLVDGMTETVVVYWSAVIALDEPNLDRIEIVVKFQST